jgi:hypothetical protein
VSACDFDSNGDVTDPQVAGPVDTANVEDIEPAPRLVQLFLARLHSKLLKGFVFERAHFATLVVIPHPSFEHDVATGLISGLRRAGFNRSLANGEVHD